MGVYLGHHEGTRAYDCAGRRGFKYRKDNTSEIAERVKIEVSRGAVAGQGCDDAPAIIQLASAEKTTAPVKIDPGEVRDLMQAGMSDVSIAVLIGVSVRP